MKKKLRFTTGILVTTFICTSTLTNLTSLASVNSKNINTEISSKSNKSFKETVKKLNMISQASTPIGKQNIKPTNWYGDNDIKDERGNETYQNGRFVTDISARISTSYFSRYLVRFEYYNDAGVMIKSSYVKPESGGNYNRSHVYEYKNYYEEQVFGQHISKATVNIVGYEGVHYIQTRTIVFGQNEEDQPPVINGVEDITINQNSNYDPKQGITATDKEDGDLTSQIIINSNVNTSKPGEYSVTYSVTDSKGHTTIKTITVTVKGTDSKPELNGLRDLIINQGSEFNPRLGVTAHDDEDGDLTSQIVISGDHVDTTKPGDYSVTYSVTDSDGHTTTKTITVTVQQDTKKEGPVLSVHDMTVKVGSNFDPLLVAAAADAQDGDLTSKITYTGYVNTDEAHDYVVNYSVTDSDNNTTTKSIVVHVVNDIGNAPVIKGADDISVVQGNYFDPSVGVTATDKEDGDLTGQIKIDNRVDITKPGDYQVTYIVWDSEFNVTEVTRKIHVKPNTNTAPELQLVATSVSLNVGDAFDAKSYILKAFDAEDGDLKDKVVISGDSVNTSKEGIYNVIYTVKDSDGNVTTKTLKVTVGDGSGQQNTPPVIQGAIDRTIVKGSDFDPMDGVTATDKEDGDLTSKVKVSGFINTSKVGSYEITYSVTDSGDLKTEKKVTITVKDTTNTPPVINGAKDKTISVGSTYDPMTGITAVDNEDGDITSKIVVSGNVDTSKEGSYNITYTVTDSGGLITVETITITVKSIDEKPVINGADDKTVSVGSKFDPMDGVTATDKEDGDLTSKIIVTGNVDTNTPSNYQLTYTVKDSAGQETIVHRTITVETTGDIISDGDYSVSQASNSSEYFGQGFVSGTFTSDKIKKVNVIFPDGSVGYWVPIQPNSIWTYYVANKITTANIGQRLTVQGSDESGKIIATVTVDIVA